MGNNPVQRNAVHRMSGISDHFSGHFEKRIRQEGLFPRIKGHLEGREDEVIDPEGRTGERFILVFNLDIPKAVPLSFRDGPFPGNRTEVVGFQVNIGEILLFSIENPNPDILPRRQCIHPVAQIALEQDGLSLERVARAVSAAVLEHPGVERGRGLFSLFLLVYVN